MYHWKKNVMVINICNRPMADFCAFLGYWPSKSGSRDGEFVSLVKSMVFGIVGKITSFRLFLSK